jgi:hypothetical protein
MHVWVSARDRPTLKEAVYRKSRVRTIKLLGDELRKDEGGRLETEIQPVIRAQMLQISKSQMRSQHRAQPINHSIPCEENLCQHKSVPQPGWEIDGLTLLRWSRSA